MKRLLLAISILAIALTALLMLNYLRNSTPELPAPPSTQPGALQDNPPITGTPQVVVRSAWSQPSIGKMGVAYLTLHNQGDGPAIVKGASSPLAERVEIHTHMLDHAGVARMRPIPSIVVPAGETVAMKPGGLHLMLFDLKEPLKADQEIPLTLDVEKQGNVQAISRVRTDIPTEDHHSHGDDAAPLSEDALPDDADAAPAEAVAPASEPLDEAPTTNPIVDAPQAEEAIPSLEALPDTEGMPDQPQQ